MSHPSPLAAVQHRALALRAAGDLGAARQLLAEAVGSPPPPYSDDHPEMLHTAHLLARLHREADDPLGSRRVLEEAFAAGERRWEHSDPVLLAIAFELAEVAQELGNRHEARRNYTRVATAGPAVLGEHHPAVRAARDYLGLSASPPTEQHNPLPPPGPEPVSAPPDSGARSALSGPTLSLATLAAMRPSAGGPAATTSPWAPPQPLATPRATPPGVRAPAAASDATAPAPAPRVQPIQPATTPPMRSGPPAPSLAPPSQPGPSPTVSQPSGPTVESQQPTSGTKVQPPAPTSGSQLPRPRAESQPLLSSEQRPPRRPPTGSPVAPRQRVGDHPNLDAADHPAATPAPTPAPRWDDPTIQVRQIEPLLAEEAARTGASPTGANGSVDAPGLEVTSPGGPLPTSSHPGPARPVGGAPAQPVSAPPAPPQPISAPPAHPHPVSGPPGHPVSAPPISAPPTSAPPAPRQAVFEPPQRATPGPAPSGAAPSVPPWGLTAPPWSRSGPPQPNTDADAAELSATDAEATGGGGESGLDIFDAAPVPTQRARVSSSDETEVLPAVAPSSGPPSGYGGPSQPVTAQGPVVAQPGPTAAPLRPAATPVEPTPAAWSPGSGGVAPLPAPQHHQATPAEQAGYPSQEHYPGQALYPGQQYQQAQDAYRPAYADEDGSAGRNRATLIGAVVAAGVAVVAVAGLGAVVLTRDDPPPSGAAPTAVAPTGVAPTAAGPPPGDLKLRDNSTTITLTWTDPSGGAVPFMVAAGRAGQALGVMATVDPGKTSYTVNGLNSRVDHCFTVLAVYSTDSFATSGQVCTARERTTPSSGKPSGRPSPS
ncbi:hypothetical protein AB0C47_12900 [Micromonospora taraxaci]|uniref:hypothetical protein n=1 Tax=Micromonospora taraxaci TaxID=1316803 RepID=UPI00340E0C2C